MSLINLDEAANRIGVPRSTVEQWVKNGLLRLEKRPSADKLPLEECVDEAELFAQAENLGWFELATENWDSVEEE